MQMTPFAQSVMAMGQQRGYSPTAIAAILGNGQQESGNDPNTDPGDDGTAFGAMQWRGPRWAALQSLAKAQGKDVTDPNIQATHLFNELDGPESKAGAALKGATDLNSANDAMKQYLRYGDDSYGTRLQNASAWSQNLGGGAKASQGVGALSPPTPTPSAVGGLYDALTGGPGALSAEGPDGLGPVQRFGEGLQGMGAALMARDNPAGAAALRAGVTSAQNSRLQLAQLALQKQKIAKNLTDATNDTVLAKTSTGVLKQKADGTTYVVPIPKDMQEADDNSVPQKLMTSIAPTVTSVTQSMDIDSKLQDLQEKLAKGQFSMRADQQGKFILQNLTDKSSEGAQAAKDYQALLNQYVEGVMNANKGAGTQWKRDMAVATAIPAGGQWDNAQILDGMQRIRDLNKNRYEGYSQQLKQMEQAYPDFAKQAPNGSWIKTFGEHEAKRDKRDAESIQPLMKQFKENRLAKQSGISAADQILQQWRNK